MIKNLINNFKNFDKTTNRILKAGLKFCFILGIISLFLLLTYIYFFASPFLYYLGISFFKLSLTFSVEFIICSLVTDGIKKQFI